MSASHPYKTRIQEKPNNVYYETQMSTVKTYVENVLMRCFTEDDNNVMSSTSSGLNNSSNSFYFMTQKKRNTGTKVFCGMHAVSLTKKVLEDSDFRSKDFITPKTDGWMYQIIVSPNGIFAVGRDDKVVQLNQEVTEKINAQLTKNSRLAETVLDMEVIPLKDHPEGYDYLFAIFELLMFQGNSYVQKAMYHRLSILQQFVVEKTDEGFDRRTMQNGGIRCDITQAKNPLVLMKVYYTLEEIHQLELKLQEINWVGCDGIMIAKRDMSYIPHTSRQLVKWKPLDKNTIDFKVSITKIEPLKVSIKYIVLDHQRNDVVYTSKEFRCDNKKELAVVLKKDGTIQECRWNAIQNIWVFCKTRKDKSHPNSLEVAKNIVLSIEENLTTQQIQDYVLTKDVNSKQN